MTRATVTQRKGSYFIQFVHNRVFELNKNFLAVITGPTGSGKSYSAVALAEKGDPDFDVRNIVFTPQELLALVNGNHKKLKRGAWIVFDEIQVSMSHLDALTMQAKLVNFLFQTFRHRNLVLIMTSPDFSFINASVRKLVHCRAETRGIDVKLKRAKLRVYMRQINQKSAKEYEKFLRVIKDHQVIPMPDIWVYKPSKDLLHAYETKKNEFTRNLNKEIEFELKWARIRKEKRQIATTDKVQKHEKTQLLSGDSQLEFE